MTPAFVAERIGVSRRTLYRAFAVNDLTVSAAIRTARAHRVVRLLRQDPKLSSSDLAAASGFSSVSSMRQALKNTYESTVSDLRVSAQG